MVRKDIRWGTGDAIYRHARDNNKYIKDSDKNKEPSYLQYWYVSNSYGWAMFQKLLTNNFVRIDEDDFQFNEGFIKNYNEKSDEGYFLEVDVWYLDNLHNSHNDLPFLKRKDEDRRRQKACS